MTSESSLAPLSEDAHQGLDVLEGLGQGVLTVDTLSDEERRVMAVACAWIRHIHEDRWKASWTADMGRLN